MNRRSFLKLAGGAAAAAVTADAGAKIVQAAAFVPSERLMAHRVPDPPPTSVELLAAPLSIEPGKVVAVPGKIVPAPPPPYTWVVRPDGIYLEEYRDELEMLLGEAQGQKLHEAMLKSLQEPKISYFTGYSPLLVERFRLGDGIPALEIEGQAPAEASWGAVGWALSNKLRR